MPRTSSFQVVTHTGHFSPLQLQPRALLSISFNALSRWLKEHWVSFPRLIREHRRSVVIMGASLHYESSLGFFDCDALDVSATFRVLKAGARAQLDVAFSGDAKQAARVRIQFCPVVIDDPVSLAASPGPFSADLLARLHDDEVLPDPPERPMPTFREQIEGTGIKLAEHAHSFVLYRHLCEVADQWAFLEVPGLVGASREGLALERGRDFPLLSDGIGKPLRRFEMELMRPYFWLQPGQVITTAYRVGDDLALVHRLTSNIPGSENYGVIVEQF